MSQHSVYTPEKSYEENALKEAMSFLKEQLEDGTYLSDSDIFKAGLFHMASAMGFSNLPMAFRWLAPQSVEKSNTRGWE